MNKVQNKEWFELKEVGGSLWHFRFMLWATIHLPLKIVEFIALIICFFFWIFASSVRKRSDLFFLHLKKFEKNKKSYFLHSYLHIYSFALFMIEKLRGFGGALSVADIETCNDDYNEFAALCSNNQGAIILCSHLGNMEMLRSVAGSGQMKNRKNFKVYPVVDFSRTSKFNNLLCELNPELMKNVIDANSIGPDSAVYMKERLEQGNVIAIAGDRVSANSLDRYFELPFLGAWAKFPEGVFTLAVILNAPIYFAFTIRKRNFDITSHYTMHIIKAKSILNSFCNVKRTRQEKIRMLAKEYSEQLQKFCVKTPYQWYNFYDFWKQ